MAQATHTNQPAAASAPPIRRGVSASLPPATIHKWLRDLDVENVLIENVREFKSYGPLDKNGYMVRSRMGEYYKDFIRTIENFGYGVEARVH